MYSKEDRERILADLPKHSRYPEATRREAGLGERLRREYGYPPKAVLGFLGMPKSSYEYARRCLK